MGSNACKMSQKLGQNLLLYRSKEKYFIDADEASINSMIKNTERTVPSVPRIYKRN